MNATDVLMYGHYTVLEVIDGLDETHWYTPGVCGVWSVKDIIAHLASFEHVLVDVLESMLDDNSPIPALDNFVTQEARFNDVEVLKRNDHSMDQVLDEYNETFARVEQLLDRIPQAVRRQNGALPWYGEEYDLDDFITYTFYGHKREHAAQIAAYRDQLEREAVGAFA